MAQPVPSPRPEVGLKALQAILRERHPLAALQVFHAAAGDVFGVNLPGFKPVMLVGPEAAHFVLVQRRGDLRWRNESDPVTDLLRHGVLVEDGEEHDRLRHLMMPALHRNMLSGYVEAMWWRTDQVTARWRDGGVVTMLDEMRRAALLILMDTLYDEDFTDEVRPLWRSILKNIQYVSPGLWMLWRGAPRPGYGQARAKLDGYLYRIIAARRARLERADTEPHDLLGLLIRGGLDDGLIRDQLLTMLIAGHDTSTALLSWSLYLLGAHPQALARAQYEVDAMLGSNPPDAASLGELHFLDAVMQEALRLYPPIHLGSRVAAVDLEYAGFEIPAGTRVIYSIFLTQRHPAYWPEPDRFNPERHLSGERPVPYAWLAFGGGPRNCIGSAYGQVEVKVVLARVLQQFDLALLDRHIHPHMGATLEPRPGVRMRVARRAEK